MYRVDIINKGDSSFMVTSKDYEFIIDTKGKGITPPDTLKANPHIEIKLVGYNKRNNY